MRGARLDHWFSADDPWPCTSPERLALLARLEAEFRPLEDAQTGTRVGIGVATGADDVFITADSSIVEAERQGRCVECPIVPAFRLRLSQNRNQLDLGCCVFKFDTVSK